MGTSIDTIPDWRFIIGFTTLQTTGGAEASTDPGPKDRGSV